VRRRRLLWLWTLGLGLLGLVAALWLARVGVVLFPSQAVLTIPKGTNARLESGRGSQVIPAKIELRVGDLFILRNEDIAPHHVGGFYVRPGQSLSYRFNQAGTFDFLCTVHRDGHIKFEVEARPSLAVLGWTELTLLGVLVLVSGFLLGARSNRLRIGALATGSAISILGLFLTINPNILRTKQKPANRPLPSVKSLEIGRGLYQRLCEICHGTSGRGDGPLATTLTPRPANLIEHVPEHSDRILFWFISAGIPGTRMPALRATLTQEEIWHLVNYIKTLAEPPPTFLQGPGNSTVNTLAQQAASPNGPGVNSAQKRLQAAMLNKKAPSFVLTDQEGKFFDSSALRGKIVVLDFIYTSCPGVCPLFTANFAELQRWLKPEQKSVVFLVSITTDPEIDSPKILKAYAQRYKADFSNWAFLTGTKAQLKEVWKGFGIRVVRKARGLVQHDSVTTLIDPQGARRFNYWGERVRVKNVERDLLVLLGEPAKPKH
jgi:protein SCO1/2